MFDLVGNPKDQVFRVAAQMEATTHYYLLNRLQYHFEKKEKNVTFCMYTVELSVENRHEKENIIKKKQVIIKKTQNPTRIRFETIK